MLGQSIFSKHDLICHVPEIYIQCHKALTAMEVDMTIVRRMADASDGSLGGSSST